MKKITFFLTAILFCSLLLAQAPQGISHQAVIRNSLNEIVTNSTVGIRVSILQGSPTGTEVYRETHTPQSNANGLITDIIGQGVAGTGIFDSIGWSNGPYFLKTEADPTGGTNYTITGTTQIMSVPYALYSNNGFVPAYSGSDPRPVLYDNGTIGIGTSTNWAKLNVNGRIVIQPGEATWGSQINIDGSPVENGKVFQLASTGGDAAEGQGKLIIGCSGKGNIMVLDSSLNVGIGTDNPVSKLDVMGDINVNSNNITNVADPVNNSDAATKAYVDSRTPIHYLGESYGGGIVFYVYDGGQHGLIADTVDQSTSMRWYAGDYTLTMAKADGVGAGKANTAIIIANQGYGDGATYAGRVCNEYSVTVAGVTYGDWYLPSKYELNLLYLQKAAFGGFASAFYWSSSEVDLNSVWVQNLASGSQYDHGKYHDAYYVRAIRAF
jgi:hypothetical protein